MEMKRKFCIECKRKVACCVAFVTRKGKTFVLLKEKKTMFHAVLLYEGNSVELRLTNNPMFIKNK